jgi:hypothetical protein
MYRFAIPISILLFLIVGSSVAQGLKKELPHGGFLYMMPVADVTATYGYIQEGTPCSIDLNSCVNSFFEVTILGSGKKGYMFHSAVGVASPSDCNVQSTGENVADSTPTGRPNETNASNRIRIRTTDKKVEIERVAVIGKQGELCSGAVDDGQGIAELVEGELLGLYDVVERRHLEDILQEQRLAMSGLIFEDSDFAKAGCLAGAQGTVIVSYSCLQDKTKLQIKLVDCSTSDLFWSATGIDVSEFDLLDALRRELSKR